MTGIGPVAVRQPRVRDREVAAGDPGRIRFAPAILHAALEVDRDAAADSLSEGHLDRRFLRGARGFAGRGRAGAVPTAVLRLRDGWIDEHNAWQKRDLSAKRYVYVWADGIYLQARLEDEKHWC
jgi:putative transposase